MHAQNMRDLNFIVGVMPWSSSPGAGAGILNQVFKECFQVDEDTV